MRHDDGCGSEEEKPDSTAQVDYFTAMVFHSQTHIQLMIILYFPHSFIHHLRFNKNLQLTSYEWLESSVGKGAAPVSQSRLWV